MKWLAEGDSHCIGKPNGLISALGVHPSDWVRPTSRIFAPSSSMDEGERYRDETLRNPVSRFFIQSFDFNNSLSCCVSPLILLFSSRLAGPVSSLSSFDNHSGVFSSFQLLNTLANPKSSLPSHLSTARKSRVTVLKPRISRCLHVAGR